MRKLTQLWRAIEDAAGLGAVRAAWSETCGADFVQIEGFLFPTHEFATRYPCPHPTGYNCPRLIIEDGDGGFEALCQDPHKLCQDLFLTARDVVLHDLDLEGFTKPILNAAGIREPTLALRSPGLWRAGLSRRRSSLNQPCFLLIFCDSDGFQAAARELLLEVAGPFLIVAPTNRHRTVALQERLQARGIGYVTLDEQVLLQDDGRFVAVDPIDSNDKLPPTPVADRDRIAREFRKKHKCKVYQIQKAAGVLDPEYYGWLRGTDPDHYANCIRIEQVLHHGLPPVREK